MKHVRILSLALAAALLPLAAARAQVGVSINFAEPGVFGRVDIGQTPPPQVIAPQPVIVAPPPPQVAAPAPIYMWVPPEHREHWERYCHEYHACGHPVYFVDHDWYQRHVMTRARGHEERREERRDEHREERHEHGDYDRRD